MKNLFILFGIAFASLLVTLSSQTIIPNGTGVGGSSSSSGGGATSLSAITDFALTRTSATVMTINAAATTSAVVNGRVGTTRRQFTSSGAVTISACGGNETQRWYQSAADREIHLRPSGTACTYTSTGTTTITIDTAGGDFPDDSDPFWITTNTATSWDALTGTMDQRAPNSIGRTITGSGCIAATTTATSTDLDGSACGGAPGGSSGQWQYNNAGVLGGSSAFSRSADGGLVSALGSLTGSSSPFLSSTATWNNPATTFTHVLVNVTDTASSAGSLLMDLQAGGTSQFYVRKDGRVEIKGIFLWPDAGLIGTNNRGFISLSADGNWTFYSSGLGGAVSHLFGGTGSSFPRITRSTTKLLVELADQSDGAAIQAGTYETRTNCSSAASPAVCASAAAGSVAIAAAATAVVVNTTAVTANSQIMVIQDDSLGTKLSVTCYTAANTAPRITARTAATSFTITATAPVTNPGCYSYTIVN